MRTRGTTAALIAFWSCACGCSESPEGRAGRAVVETLPVAPLVAPRGESREARVRLHIAGGFHIQANPASQPYLIPATLDLQAAEGVQARAPVYPPGTAHRLRGAAQDLSTYEGTIEIAVPVTVALDARPGERVLRGTFRYQACDARVCLAPAAAPVAVLVSIR